MTINVSGTSIVLLRTIMLLHVVEVFSKLRTIQIIFHDDAYIEIILNDEGFVSGDVCFIQLKSTDKIKWKNGKAKLSGIKKSTINYWMSLPAPVFIFWIDLSTEELFFCSIKSFIRKKFVKYKNSEKTMSITFKKLHNLEDEMGMAIFLFFYFYDKHQND